MRPLLLLCLLGAATLQAQYLDLSTTADGSIVYFSTTLARAGTDDPTQGRIYSIGADGLKVVEERRREDPTGQPAVTNYYWLSAPEVSQDGRLLAITGHRDCTSGRNCVGVTTTQTTIRGLALTGSDLRAPVHFSPNSRYALVEREQNLSAQPAALIDLTTGERTTLSFFNTATRPGFIVTDNGRVVSADGWVHIWDRTGNRTTLTDLLQEDATSAVTDRSGSVIVYTSRWDYPHAAFSRIRVVDPTTRAQRTLIEGFADFYQPVVTADGRRVLFLTTSRFDDSGFLGPAQAYVINIDGTGLRPVTRDPAGVKLAILSGDGRVAFAITNAGRLLRIDVDSGAEMELLPRTISIDATFGCLTGPVTPGSLRLLSGVAYDDEPVRILFDDMEAPIVSRRPGEVLFQIPWEMAGRNATLRIETAILPGPFQQPELRTQLGFGGNFGCIFSLPAEYGTRAGYGFVPYSLAFGQDYRLITPDNPARLGEAVNFYATGLGAVDPPVATGQPGPVEPLARLRDGIQCNLPVLYAGLAPGLVGIYQLQLQLPADPEPTYGLPELTGIRCSVPGSGDFYGLLPVKRN